MKTKISKKALMTMIVMLCIALSVYVLNQWSGENKITAGMVFVSLLIHVAIPSFFAWTVIYKKLTV